MSLDTTQPGIAAILSAAAIPVDTGYTAAAATPSKSVSLPTWTAGGITGGIVTAANAIVGASGLGTVLGNMDTQLAALTARLSQLEATAAAGKFPNA